MGPLRYLLAFHGLIFQLRNVKLFVLFYLQCWNQNISNSSQYWDLHNLLSPQIAFFSLLYAMERLLKSLLGLRLNLGFQNIDSVFSELNCNLFHILQKEDAQYLRQFSLLLMHPQTFQMCYLLVYIWII